MKTIKIICGKNGGCGKTRLMVAETIYNVRKNRKVVTFDWNLNNPDFLAIMHFFDKINTKEDPMFMSTEVYVDNTQKKMKLFFPNKAQEVQDDEFWHYLYNVYQKSLDDTIMVVDTRVDVTRLPVWNGSFKMSNFNDVKIEIYYIWGWVYRDEELSLLKKSMEWLEKNIKNIEIIHVWNVYEQKKPRKLFKGIHKEYNKMLGNTRPLKLTTNTLTDLIEHLDLTYDTLRGIDANEIPELWEPLFGRLIDKAGKYGCIMNWLFIPEKIDMAFGTDADVMANRSNIRSIQQNMKKFYDYIYVAEKMRDRLA